MKIVVNCNRVIAALLKKATTRQILLNKNFEFIVPSFILSEINKYKDYIKRKTSISEQDFKILISIVFENIKIIHEIYYGDLIEEIKDEISDIKDIAYLAVAMAMKTEGIWSHDPHFKEQNKVKVFTNIDLLKIINRN